MKLLPELRIAAQHFSETLPLLANRMLAHPQNLAKVPLGASSITAHQFQHQPSAYAQPPPLAFQFGKLYAYLLTRHTQKIRHANPTLLRSRQVRFCAALLAARMASALLTRDESGGKLIQ